MNGFAHARQGPLQVSDPLGLHADAVHAEAPHFDAPRGVGLPDGMVSELGRSAPGASKNCPDCTQVAGRVSDVATVCV
ncbi:MULTISPECIES: hypothetical protein [unclassified Variovorax]|uniref:hypothetical protein n=1 Tax=unclassified Variovorax TaxID=663243 RepID=UPI0011601E55|nr:MULTISPECIES: hypothetical protein [unclassified Variovorax]